MKRLLYVVLLFASVCIQASAPSDAPNFYIVNNAKKDIHFVLVGANDLPSVKNLKLHSPCITTLKPGEHFQEHTSLRGNIDDKPLLEADGYHLMSDSPCKSQADPLGSFKVGQIANRAPCKHTWSSVNDNGEQRCMSCNLTRHITGGI